MVGKLPRSKKLSTKKMQAALEYVFLIAGAIVFIVFVLVVLRTGVFSTGGERVANTTHSYLDTAQPFVCWDNFDAEVLDDYELVSGAWKFSDRKLASDSADTRILLDCRPTYFSLSVELKNTNPNGVSTVVFRAQNSSDNANPADYYTISVRKSAVPNHVVFELFNQYGVPLSPATPVQAVGDLAAGVKLNVSINNSAIVVSINGASFHVAEYVFLIGQVGFAANAPGAEFNDLAVVPLPAMGPIPLPPLPPAPPAIWGITYYSIPSQEGGYAGVGIRWSTDQSSNSSVEYGMTNAYGNRDSVAAFTVPSHDVVLGSFNPGADEFWNYRVTSCTVTNLCSTSGDNVLRDPNA